VPSIGDTFALGQSEGRPQQVNLQSFEGIFRSWFDGLSPNGIEVKISSKLLIMSKAKVGAKPVIAVEAIAWLFAVRNGTVA